MVRENLREKWFARHVTDSAQNILGQICSRANDRGLLVVEGSTIIALTLWSILLWERKVGRVALERSGVDRFELARGLDLFLDEKEQENPVAFDQRRGILVLVKTRERYQSWDFDALLEPLLQQAEHEALDLGHDYVGSEHLVLAIIRMADPPLVALLQQHGISHEKVRESVFKILQG